MPLAEYYGNASAGASEASDKPVLVTNIPKETVSVGVASAQLPFLGTPGTYKWISVFNNGAFDIYLAYNEAAVVGANVHIPAGQGRVITPPLRATINAISDGGVNNDVQISYQSF